MLVVCASFVMSYVYINKDTSIFSFLASKSRIFSVNALTLEGSIADKIQSAKNWNYLLNT